MKEIRYNLKVWYKYNLVETFIQDCFNNINEDILKLIIARFEKDYMNNAYVALRIEYDYIIRSMND